MLDSVEDSDDDDSDDESADSEDEDNDEDEVAPAPPIAETAVTPEKAACSAALLLPMLSARTK